MEALSPAHLSDVDEDLAFVSSHSGSTILSELHCQKSSSVEVDERLER